MNILTVSERHTPIGRCDATCYNASGTKCTCICRGANHGKGLQHALNFAAQTAAAIDALGRRGRGRVTIHDHDLQQWLFPLDIEPSSDSIRPAISGPTRSLPVEPEEPSGS